MEENRGIALVFPYYTDVSALEEKEQPVTVLFFEEMLVGAKRQRSEAELLTLAWRGGASVERVHVSSMLIYHACIHESVLHLTVGSGILATWYLFW